jgi:serine/threonine protein phosphatase PrpC
MSVYVSNDGTQIEFATLSRQGQRESNEDVCGHWASAQGACFVVCDGVGGNGGGDVAADTAVRTLLSAFAATPDLARENIESIIAQTDAAVRYGQKLGEHLRDMSATIAALFLDGDLKKAQWINLGDTRLYHFRLRDCRLLTKDHSVVQSFVDAGILDETQVRNHVKRGLLLAALGFDDKLPAITLNSATLDVEDGDAFLLCTDGLWEPVIESEMFDALRCARSAEEWLLRMEQHVIARNLPRHDNYSALAVWIGPPHEITLPESVEVTGIVADATLDLDRTMPA